MKILFGGTGLVGSALQQQTQFDFTYSSNNFRQISSDSLSIDHLVLCCLPATKWKINQDPLKDLENIFAIIDELSNVYAERITLISTIDIYGHQCSFMDETTIPPLGSPSYGSNRLLFEELAQLRLWYGSLQIIRLPALFHPLIKKNILFDLIHDHQVEKINLNSCYQWYPLQRLWQDLEQCPHNGPTNLFPAPIETEAILQAFFPEAQCQHGERVEYNHFTMRTESGYWPPSQSDNFALIGDFINETRS
jgi:hypothetical protein